MTPPIRRSSSMLALATVVALAGLARAASAQEIALMNRADRQKILVEGAKKEGKVSWYTTLIVDQVVRPVKAAFEKKYPFIQVEFFRGNTARIVQRMIAEYQAKRYEADLIDGTVSPTMVRRAGLLQRFNSPMSADYPAELKDAQGFWAATNLYFFATGYNTRMVKPDEVPKTYEDLLNPRWKGQMMWSTSRGSGAPMFVGTILNTMGNEPGKAYLQKLKLQNVAKTSASNRQVLDMTIAGEYPLALQMFNHNAFISKSAGAPVEWQPHEPATATINNIGLGKFASHPHAAMLLIDFILSEKGQRVYQQSNYLPAHPKVLAKQIDLKPGGGRFKRAFYINPDQQYDKGNEWADYFENLFMKWRRWKHGKATIKRFIGPGAQGRYRAR